MVNNKSISDYQQNAQITFLLVEPMTGVTTKMFKNYQVFSRLNLKKIFHIKF